jgi:hypothetical protein
MKIKAANRNRNRLWTREETEALFRSYYLHNGRNWKAISAAIPGRSIGQCTARLYQIYRPHEEKPWTKQEDERLLELVSLYGTKWRDIEASMKDRSSIEIRRRYHNSLKQVPRENGWTPEEDEKLLQLCKRYGKGSWSTIAANMPGRSATNVRSRYYYKIRSCNTTFIPENSSMITELYSYIEQLEVMLHNARSRLCRIKQDHH